MGKQIAESSKLSGGVKAASYVARGGLGEVSAAKRGLRVRTVEYNRILFL